MPYFQALLIVEEAQVLQPQNAEGGERYKMTVLFLSASTASDREVPIYYFTILYTSFPVAWNSLPEQKETR